MKARLLILIIPCTIFWTSCTQKIALTNSDQPGISIQEKATADITAFQEKINSEYSSKDKSPLDEEQKEKFIASGGHDFFPINLDYRVEANLDTNVDVKNIKFETTTDRVAVYDLYGIASFRIGNKDYKVNIYQSQMRFRPKALSHLFLPFNDLTNGDTTYGGGRYVDVEPSDDSQTITIDFNKSYSPYCAYNSKYSCPIPPIENRLDVEIKAGVQHLKEF